VFWLVPAFLPSALFLGLLLLILPNAVHAAPAVFQKAQGFTGAPFTSITVPYGSSNAGGATTVLVAFAYVNLSQFPTITISDTQVNTWISAKTGTLDGTAGMWYVLTPNAGANSVTASAAGTNLLQLQIYEIRGFAALPVKRTVGQSSPPCCVALPTATTEGVALVGDFVLASAWNDGNFTFTAGAGFALEQQQCGSF